MQDTLQQLMEPFESVTSNSGLAQPVEVHLFPTCFFRIEYTILVIAYGTSHYGQWLTHSSQTKQMHFEKVSQSRNCSLSCGGKSIQMQPCKWQICPKSLKETKQYKSKSQMTFVVMQLLQICRSLSKIEDTAQELMGVGHSTVGPTEWATQRPDSPPGTRDPCRGRL